MAQANRDTSIQLSWELDPQSVNAVKSAVDNIAARLQALGGETAKTSATMQRLTDASKSLARAQDIDGLARQFVALGKSADDADGALIQMRQAMRDIGSDASEIDQATDAFRRMNAEAKAAGQGINPEGLRRTGGAITQLGGGDVGGLLMRAGDLSQVAKEAEVLVGSLGALAPVLAIAAGAVVGFQIGMKVLDAQIAESKKGLEGAVAGLKAYYAALDNGTTESITKQKKALEDKVKLEQAELDQLTKARANAFAAEQKNFGGDALARVKFAIGDSTGAFKDIDERIKALTTSTTEASSQLSALDRALQSTDVAANDAKAAEDKLTSARIAGIDESLQRELKLAGLQRANTGSKQLQEMVDAAQAEFAGIDERIAELKKEAETSDEAKKKLEEYQKRLAALSSDIANYNVLLSDAKTREALKGFADGLFKSAQDAGKKAADAFNKALSEANARDNQAVGAVTKLNADLKAIDERTAQERTAIQERYNNALVTASRDAANKAADALRNLTDQQASLAEKLRQDENNAQLKVQQQQISTRVQFARDEEKAAREHAQRLEQIQAQSQLRKEELILNGDFAGLYQLQLQRTADQHAENTSYNNANQQRQIDLKAKQQDEAQAAANERQVRLQAYQQAVADAHKRYQQELEAAARAKAQAVQLAYQAEQTELRQAQNKATSEIALRQQAAKAELSVIYQTEAEKLKIYNTTLAQVRQMQPSSAQNPALLRAGAAGVSSVFNGLMGLIRPHASGGYMSAGEVGLVNEGRKFEAFNGQSFPASPGLFMALQGGMVNNASSGGRGPISVTLNVSSPSADPRAVAQIAADQIRQFFSAAGVV